MTFERRDPAGSACQQAPWNLDAGALVPEDERYLRISEHSLGHAADRLPQPPMAVCSHHQVVGTELTSSPILRWSQERRVEWHYISTGKPMQNGFVESFDGRCGTNASTQGLARKPVPGCARLR